MLENSVNGNGLCSDSLVTIYDNKCLGFMVYVGVLFKLVNQMDIDQRYISFVHNPFASPSVK